MSNVYLKIATKKICIFVIKSKLLKKQLRSTLVPSESEEEHDGEEIKSTTPKTSNTEEVAGPHQKRKTVRYQRQPLSQDTSFDQILIRY